MGRGWGGVFTTSEGIVWETEMQNTGMPKWLIYALVGKVVVLVAIVVVVLFVMGVF